MAVALEHDSFRQGIREMLGYRLIAIWLILCLIPVGGFAKVYRYIDKDGVERFSNRPPPDGATIIDTEKEIEYDEAADQAQQERSRKAAKDFANQPPKQTPTAPPTQVKDDTVIYKRSGGGHYRYRPRKEQIPKKQPVRKPPVERKPSRRPNR